MSPHILEALIAQGENSVSLTLHGLTFAGIVLILGILLKQHGIYVLLKNRLNTLWHKHCEETGEHYTSLDEASK